MDVLPFLSRLQEIANEGGVSEGILLRLFLDMLIEPALTAFRDAKPMSYPAAIKWFLLTYASEATVAERWCDLQMMKQEDPESPSEFAIRQQSAAHRLGPLVGPAELKALYEGGLTDNVRHMLRATLKPDQHRTIADTVSAAAALAQAMGRPSPLRPTERTNRISALSRTAAHPALIV
jgi:hypothetical protein